LWATGGQKSSTLCSEPQLGGYKLGGGRAREDLEREREPPLTQPSSAVLDLFSLSLSAFSSRVITGRTRTHVDKPFTSLLHLSLSARFPTVTSPSPVASNPHIHYRVLLMASLEPPPPTSWPRMRSGVENPFQNAPGPFIFALPNLAGACPSVSSDTISDCSLACPYTPFDDDQDDDEYFLRRQNRCHNPPETPRHSPVEETAGPLTEDADPEDLHPVPHSPFDDADDDNDSDSDDTSTSSSQHPQQQQSSSGSSTPTPSHTHSSSPPSSEFSEDPQEDAEDSPKEKGRRKRRSGQGARRRRRNRQLLEQNGCVMGPRAMGIPGVHLQGWFQRSHPHSHSHSQLPPLLPSAMPGVGHAHVLFPVAYYGHAVTGSSSPMTWLLPLHAAPPVPGFFG